jgi:uncharacterized protein involved in type VI secretion and phage assembly
MASLVNNQGQAVSGKITYPIHAKVIENDSDDYKGHVRLKLLGMAESESDAPETQWVRLLTPMGGKEFGFYCMPEVDEVLVILFDRGDQSSAMVLGSYWSKADPPPPESKDGMPGAGETDTGGKKSTAKFTDGSSDLKKNDRRLWKSRSGHIICFDDTDGKESVQIWDKSHKLCIALDTKEGNIFVTNNNNDIHVRTKNDLYLEAGNDILVQAGNNMEVDTGTDYLLKAGSNFKVEAKSNAEIKATSDFKAEGMNVKIEGKTAAEVKSVKVDVKASAAATVEGSASCTIKGGMVSIN